MTFFFVSCSYIILLEAKCRKKCSYEISRSSLVTFRFLFTLILLLFILALSRMHARRSVFLNTSSSLFSLSSFLLFCLFLWNFLLAPCLSWILVLKNTYLSRSSSLTRIHSLAFSRMPSVKIFKKLPATTTGKSDKCFDG